MGEPQLSSVTTVPVYVHHVATVPPEIGLGFAESSYNVEVPENAGDNTLIKTITIINSHAHDTMPLRCEIYSGNENGLFEANVTEERNCALWLKRGALDYETTESYQIKIRLESLSGLLNSGRNTTMVRCERRNDTAILNTYNYIKKGKEKKRTENVFLRLSLCDKTVKYLFICLFILLFIYGKNSMRIEKNRRIQKRREKTQKYKKNQK